jgi:phosphomethylpyrimidine synthase
MKISQGIRRDAAAQNDAGGALAEAEGGVVEVKVD